MRCLSMSLSATLTILTAAALIVAAPPAADAREGNYLVITGEQFNGTTPLNEFIAHRSGQGFNVMTYVVASGTSNTTIKNHIASLWGTADAPKYILLVGDTSDVPYWTGGGSKSAPTDLPYACMDSGDDWHPEIAIGRFSVSSETELQAVVDKTIKVESGVFSDPEYVSRATFLATSDTSAEAEETHDWVITNYIEPADYTPIRIYANQGGGTSDVFDAVENGTLLMVYFGHSSSSGWWTPSFDQSDVNSLTNEGLYGLVFGFSCNTANYPTGECCGETWIRRTNAGAAAYISASTYIYYGGDAWDSSRQVEKCFFRAMFVNNIWEIGPAWQAGMACFDNNDDFSDDVKRNMAEMFVILGDPALLLPQPDGFGLEATPTLHDLCVPPDTEAAYTLDVSQLGDFSEPVTLSATDLPLGASVDFDVNTQAPPFTSIMTIDDLSSAPANSYTIEITATSASMQRVLNVTLNISTSVADAPTLVSPTDGAFDVARTPTLSWMPNDAALEYDIEVATDSGFGNVVYTATVPESNHTVGSYLDSLTEHFWHVKAINGCGESGFSSAYSFITIEQPDYFTEEFDGSTDLENTTLMFWPDGGGSHYAMCSLPATELPTDPAGGTELSLDDDSASRVDLTGDPVVLYGTSYDHFWIGSNGYLTFESADTGYSVDLENHFDQARISLMLNDLNPSSGGTISYLELSDRMVVTYLEVPEFSSDNDNTVQVEMFFDGTIRCTWLQIDCTNLIIGLSGGFGLPGDYVETDLSAAAACNLDGFEIEAIPATQSICAPDEATYTVEISQLGSFSDTVTLSASGHPAGSTVHFSVNNAAPPFTSTMTVSDTGSTATGDYEIEISATGGSYTEYANVGLGVSAAIPGTTALTNPADGVEGQPVRPETLWSEASDALNYDLEIATDVNFANVVYARTVNGTTHTVEEPLDTNALYFWRVRGINGCGDGDWSTPFSFRTVNMVLPTSYDMLNGETGSYSYYDDEYDGNGDNTQSLAELTDGLGDLTDGVLATENWDNDNVPFVGWHTIEPTITFHFAELVHIDTVTLHLDDSNGSGGVYPPTDVEFVMGGTTLSYEVPNPSDGAPFAASFTDCDLIGTTIEITLLDDSFSSSRYMMLSEVEFFGGPATGACCLAGNCTIESEDDCTGMGGAYQGDGTDCDPNPCAEPVPACLIISEVVDATLSGGCPRFIEIANTGLTDFTFTAGGIIVQMDSSTDTTVDVDLTGQTIRAGQAFVINSNEGGNCTGAFPSIFGFDADFYTNVAFGDGNDRYILTDTADGSNLLDIYGEFGVNYGNWIYEDGYSYRLPAFNQGNNGVFVEEEWLVGGKDSLEGDNPEYLLLTLTTPGTHEYDNDCLPTTPGDMNCDTFINFDDIDGFVLALVGQEAYEAEYPECEWFNADCDLNSSINFDDIDPFVQLLVGSAR